MLSRTLPLLACAVAACSATPAPQPAEPAEPAAQPRVERIVPPPPVTIEQLAASAGLDAPTRIYALREPLARSGLLPVIVRLMTLSDGTEYDKLKREAKFDPAERLRGVLLYSPKRKLTKRMTGAVLFAEVAGELPHEFIDYFSDSDDDDDASDGDYDFAAFVFLVDLPEPVRKRTVDSFFTVEPGDEPAQRKEMDGGATLLAQREPSHIEYGYVWSGGVITGRVPSRPGPVLVHARDALSPILAQLRRASRAKPVPSNEAASGRTTIDGTAGDFNIRVDEVVDFEFTQTLSDDDLRTNQHLGVLLPQWQDNPSVLLSGLPALLTPLVKLLLAGSSAQLVDHDLTVRVSVDAAAFKKAVAPLLTF